VHLQLTEHEITLEVTASAKDFLAEVGYDPKFGARPLRRSIQEHVDDPLSEGLLAETFGAGDIVEARYEEEEESLTFDVTGKTESTDEEPTLEAILG
jgi:ATP-dependent Clp protease ATP-binding subunit ClpC